jgi:hypothetical protein
VARDCCRWPRACPHDPHSAPLQAVRLTGPETCLVRFFVCCRASGVVVDGSPLLLPACGPPLCCAACCCRFQCQCCAARSPLPDVGLTSLSTSNLLLSHQPRHLIPSFVFLSHHNTTCLPTWSPPSYCIVIISVSSSYSPAFLAKTTSTVQHCHTTRSLINFCRPARLTCRNRISALNVAPSTLLPLSLSGSNIPSSRLLLSRKGAARCVHYY